MPHSAHRRTLLVSDNPDFLRGRLGALRDQRWRFEAVAPALASHVVADGLHDLVVLDSRGANGFTSELLAAAALARLPVLMLLDRDEREESWAPGTMAVRRAEITPTRFRRLARMAAASRLSGPAAFERESLFRSLIEAAFDGVLLVDTRFHVVQAVTPRGPIRYSSATALGRSVIGLVQPREARRVTKMLRECAAGSGRPLRGEFRVRGAGGEWREAEVIVFNRLDDPAIEAMVVCYRDVTEKRARDRRAKVRLQQFDAFFSTSPAGMVTFDCDLRIVQVNEALARLNGLTVGAHLGKRIHEVSPDFAPVIEPLLQQVLATRQPVVGATVVAAQRSQVVSCFPIFDGEADVSGVGATVVDLSDHEATRQALFASEQRYRTMTDALPEVVFELDAAGRLVSVNQTAFDWWNFGPGDLPRFDIAQAVVPADRGRLTERVLRVLAGEELTGEYLALRKDGSTFPMTVHSRPVMAGGRVVGVRGLINDVSVQRALEGQLRQAQKMEAVGRLAGGVAHDFNNVLTAILGNADLLEEDLGEADPRREYVEQIRKAAERAAALTRQLLAFSRKQVLQPRTIDLNGLVTGLERMLRRLIGEDVRMVTLAAPDLGTVSADPGQIEQVIMNLVVNARDAMPDGGTVTMETANVEGGSAAGGDDPDLPPGRYVMLAITDTGCGMPPEVKAHLFEPFFTTKEPGKGTGLGLATVYGIARQNGGRVSVRSEVGQGTSMRLYLPRADAAPAPSPASLVSGARTAPETILLVEDEESLRETAVAVLERAGYRLLPAAGSEEALAVAASFGGRIDLVVSDVVLPGINGRQLVSRLLDLRPSMKAVYMSGYADSAEQVGSAGEASGFLQKPFLATSLIAAVRAALDRPAL